MSAVVRRIGRVMTPEYRAWIKIHQRCENPRDKNYSDYGGRGITVSPDWRTFETFFAAVGARPSPLHTLDRVRNNEGYYPGNVRWATRKEQSRNRRTSWFIVALGQRRTMGAWAELSGIPYGTIKQRLKMGWTPDEAVSRPAASTARFEAFGQSRTLREWSIHSSVKYATLLYRINNGMPIEQALSAKLFTISPMKKTKEKEAA